PPRIPTPPPEKASVPSSRPRVPTPAPESFRSAPSPRSGISRSNESFSKKSWSQSDPSHPNKQRGPTALALDLVRPGSTLGRYEIRTPRARGGMAAVWAARIHGTRGFQKIVALKTMLPDVSDDPEFETMFLDEARVAARIRHPNVVEILDLGEQH